MQSKTRSHDYKHICLIGGGHAHMTAIKQMAIKSISGMHVTLISADRSTPYSGMFPGLIAGHYSFEDCHVDLQNLCQNSGVQFIHGSVQEINPDSHTIECAPSLPIRYDLLSINIGSQPAIYTICGAKTYGHSIKPFNKFLCNWHQWLAIRSDSDRKQQIVVIGGGAAGIEILLAMHHRWFNTTSKKAKFTLICADKTILSTHNRATQQFFQQYLQSQEIAVEHSPVTAIDKQQLYLQNGLSLDYDFTVWAIHAGTYQWPAQSGLQCDSHGFIQVDQYLRSVSHSNIFATGDCATFLPRKLPKAGVFAVRQGPTLFKNLVAACSGQSLTPFQPQQRFLSLLTMGGKHAVASRDFVFVHGSWVWHWKNHIDQKFINSLKR